MVEGPRDTLHGCASCCIGHAHRPDEGNLACAAVATFVTRLHHRAVLQSCLRMLASDPDTALTALVRRGEGSRIAIHQLEKRSDPIADTEFRFGYQA